MKKFIWIGIILLGVFLRVFQFGQPVRPLYVDEASLGYNSYSLLQTGRDEYGKAFPIFLRSFGAYQSGLYSYLSVVPVWVFGLHEFSVRFASVAFGLLLILIIGLAYGRLTGLVIAVSPVFVFYSRGAYEATVAMVLLYLGIVVLFRFRSLFFFSAGILFICLSAYAYHAERFVAIIALVFVTLLIWKRFKRRAIFGMFLSILFLIPLLLVSLTPGAMRRLATINSIQQDTNWLHMAAAYISPNNLFNKGDPDPQRSYPDTGTFSWWMFPFFIIGIIAVIKQRSFSDLQKTLLVVGIASLIPGIITKDYFATIRVLPYFVFIAYFIAKGIFQFRFQKLIIIFIFISSILQIYTSEILLLHERGRVWGTYYPHLITTISTLEAKPIVFDTVREKPIYILIAFYQKMDPVLLQRLHDFPIKDYYTNIEFISPVVANVVMRNIVWERDINVDQYLVADNLGVSKEQAKEHRLTLMHTVEDIYHQPILYIYKTQPKP